MAGYNQEFRSRLIADGFTFFFEEQESVGRSLTFRVSAYSRDRLIDEEIRYVGFIYATFPIPVWVNFQVTLNLLKM